MTADLFAGTHWIDSLPLILTKKDSACMMQALEIEVGPNSFNICWQFLKVFFHNFFLNKVDRHLAKYSPCANQKCNTMQCRKI